MRLLRILAMGVLICLMVVAGMIGFGTAKTPRPMQSITDPFRRVDFSDLPPLNRYTARGGAAFSYREYRALSYNGPTQRPASKPVTDGNGNAPKADIQSMVAPFTGRIIALLLLNKVGIHWFDGLPVLAFAVPPEAKSFTPTYSLRMLVNLAPRTDYLADIRNIHKSTAVMVGQQDEFSLPEQFAPVFHSQRQDVTVKIVPGMGHLDMITSPVALQAVLEWFEGVTAPRRFSLRAVG